MIRILRTGMFVLGIAMLGGCYYYEPMVTGPSVQQRYDRSWFAALGAMSDQGVAIESEDRGAGVIRGQRGGIGIMASLQTLPDGSIQVRFDQSGATGTDPTLIHRVSASYDRRMGR